MHLSWPILIFLLGWLSASGSRAAESARDPYFELLDDSFPSAAAPFPLEATQFAWRGVENLPAGATIHWVAGEVQWTRASERLVLPRARVRVSVPDVDGAVIVVRGKIQPLRPEGKRWVGEVTVPLIVTGAPLMEIRIRHGTTTNANPLTLVRIPAMGAADQISLDSSCSPWSLEFHRRQPSERVDLRRAHPSTLFAHCKLIRNEALEGLSGTLDVLFWIDGAGDKIQVDGISVGAESPSIFRLRIDPDSPPLRIDTDAGESFEMIARVPKRVNRGFFGLGIGPYRYRLQAENTAISTTAGVVTIYGSYHLTESVRLTAFNATTLHKNFFTDTGFYVKSNSARFFDQRITVYLMLGANMVGFRYSGKTRLKGGAPQGFEAVCPDFLHRNRTLTFGAFIYPPIDGKSYYNTWFRYGGSSFFGEMNYLSIRDRFDERSVASRSLGVSVGFPLARFF